MITISGALALSAMYAPYPNTLAPAPYPTVVLIVVVVCGIIALLHMLPRELVIVLQAVAKLRR